MYALFVVLPKRNSEKWSSYVANNSFNRRVPERRCSMSKYIEVAKVDGLKSGTMKKVFAEGHEILLGRVGDKVLCH